MNVANTTPQYDKFKQLLRPALIVTGFTLLGQIVNFITQVAIAATFGAQSSMDAFLAASTLPQYLLIVLLGSLNVIFLPVFVEYSASEQPDEAWRVMSGVINTCLLCLAGVTIVGMLFARPIIQLTAPGLPEATQIVAVQVAMITWPSIFVTGLMTMLNSVYQAQKRFSRVALVPIVGALLNLLLVVILGRSLGVVGIAVAATGSTILQVLLLIPVVFGKNKYRFHLNWQHAGVRQVFRLMVPLVASGLLIRCTLLVERYLASDLSQGSISYLGYAARLIGLLTLLISAGLSMVIYPQMALDSANKNIDALRQTVSLGIRMLWVVIAPIITIGAVLALPLVTVVFQRGQFSSSDALAVALLFQIYLLSLVAGCMGSITSSVFYVLKDTSTIAIIGGLEAIIYVGYTALLVQHYGVIGIAWGYVIYLDASLIWQFIIIWYKTGKRGGGTVVRSLLHNSAAAFIAGCIAWSITLLPLGSWIQVGLGASVSILVYALILLVSRSVEGIMVWQVLQSKWSRVAAI